MRIPPYRPGDRVHMRRTEYAGTDQEALMAGPLVIDWCKKINGAWRIRCTRIDGTPVETLVNDDGVGLDDNEMVEALSAVTE